MIKTKYIRRYYIEKAVNEFKSTGKCLEVGSGKRWQYFSGSLTLNRDIESEPDYVGDAENMSFEDGEFSSVVCLEVIEHTTSPENLISEIHRVLSPNGTVLLTVPFTFEIHDKQDYYRFSRQGLEYLFRNFRSVDIKPNGGKYSVIFHFLRLGLIGHFCYPLLNNAGHLLDRFFIHDEPKITLGYTVVAIK